MGVYDTVWVECPSCSHKNDFQSKSGECILEHYSLEDCPDNVLHNVNRHAPIECDNCGAKYEVDIKERKAIFSI